MWPLLFLSVVAFMVMFVCLWTTRASAVLPTRMVMSVESCIRRKDYAGLMSMCERDGSSFALTMHVIVMFLQRNPRANIEEVREVASAEGARQTNILTRQINWLSDIGAIAPMIGLLGTVVGMMKTFMEMAAGNFEGVKQMQMAHGIAEAMITTAGGLVLAGTALSAMFSGGSTLLQYFADDSALGAIVFWTFGNLGSANWTDLFFLAVVFVLTGIYFMCNRWNYNAMEAGYDTARSLGVNTRRVMVLSMAVCSFASAVAVSFVGIIGFVGLIAPHVMRYFTGNDHRYLVPGSAVTGAILLLVADIAAKIIIPPAILPIGALMSFVGGPVFLFLLFRGRNSNG